MRETQDRGGRNLLVRLASWWAGCPLPWRKKDVPTATLSTYGVAADFVTMRLTFIRFSPLNTRLVALTIPEGSPPPPLSPFKQQYTKKADEAATTVDTAPSPLGTPLSLAGSASSLSSASSPEYRHNITTAMDPVRPPKPTQPQAGKSTIMLVLLPLDKKESTAAIPVFAAPTAAGAASPPSSPTHITAAAAAAAAAAAVEATPAAVEAKSATTSGSGIKEKGVTNPHSISKLSPSSLSVSLRRLVVMGLRLLPILLGPSIFADASPTTSPGRGNPSSPPATANAKLAFSAAARVLASNAPGGSTSSSGSSGLPVAAAVVTTVSTTTNAVQVSATQKIPLPPVPGKKKVVGSSSSSSSSSGGKLMDDHSLVKLLFLIVGLFWVLVVLAFLYWAPVVSFFNLLVLGIIVCFIKSEGSSWHHAQEFENRFWTVMSFITSIVLVFSPDSPFRIGTYSKTLGWLICFCVAYAVHSYDRHLHRVNMSRKPEFVRARRGGSSLHAHHRSRGIPSTGGRINNSSASAGSASNLGNNANSRLSKGGMVRLSSGDRGAATPSPPESPPPSASSMDGNRPRVMSGSGDGAADALTICSSLGSAAISTATTTLTRGGIATAEDSAGGVGARAQRASSFSDSFPSALTTGAPVGGGVVRMPTVQQQQQQQLRLPLQSAGTRTVTDKLLTSEISDLDESWEGDTTAAMAAGGVILHDQQQQQHHYQQQQTLSHSINSGSSSSGSSRSGSSGGYLDDIRRGSSTTTEGFGIATSAAPPTPACPVPVTVARLRLLDILLQAQAGDGERVADAVVRSQMEEKLEVIEHALQAVDQYLISSTVSNWFNMQKVLRLERTIINIFNVARTDELNYLVSHITLALLFYKVKDHFLSSSKKCLNRTDLIELLAVTRISELGIHERAMVLDALQQMRLTAHPRSELWVRNILLCTLGDSLSELKSLMDAKGDFQSLHKLVFDDIRTEKIRNEILVHIRKQAYVQAAHMKLGTRLARQRRERQPWRKVLSDVDDTLASSGGRFPAGMDRRLPRHALYPGVLAFYRELDLGTTGPDEWGSDRDQGNLVFLSARPHLYKDVSEKHSYAKFRKLQDNRGMHTTPTLLAGSLDSGYSYVMERNIEGLAQKKVENFEQFVSLYPEYSFVFIGDNGQGDLRAAELMAKKAKLPMGGGSHPRIDALYIHRIQPLDQGYGYDEQAYARWREMGICFFDNYIEAAMDAAVRRQPPLIRMTGLQRVVESAVKDFFKIEGWPSAREQELRRVELNRSILRANDILAKNGLAAVPPIPSQHKSRFEVGARVMTLYGGGLVKRYRPEDGVYEILLDWTASTPQQQQREREQQQKGGSSKLRPSLGTVGEKEPAPLTPLMITPPRIDQYRSRSGSVYSEGDNFNRLLIADDSSSTPPSPHSLSSPLPTWGGTPSAEGGATTEPNNHQQQQQQVRQLMLTSDLRGGTPVTRSASANMPLSCPSPTTQGRGITRGVSPGVVGSDSGSSTSSSKCPASASSLTPVEAFLQDSAIMYAVPTATPTAATVTSATTPTGGSSSSSSSSRAGLSSYISFFPGASYLSRLRSDRGPRYPPGTYVITPYGAGVVLCHCPAAAPSPAPAAAISRLSTPKPSVAPPAIGVWPPEAPKQTAGEEGATAATPATIATEGLASPNLSSSSPPNLQSSPGTSTPAPAPCSPTHPLLTPTTASRPPSLQRKGTPETYVIALRWGAKAYLPPSVLSPTTAAPAAGSNSTTSSATTSPRGGRRVGGRQDLEPSAGILAGMMNLLSLGSGRGVGLRSGAGVGGGGSSGANGATTIILAAGMSVETRYGQALVQERREGDGLTILTLPGGMTAYVPAVSLAEFVLPRRNSSNYSNSGNGRRPRSLSALSGGNVSVGLPLSSGGGGRGRGGGGGGGGGGGEGNGRRSLSPYDVTGGTSSSLLGFLKGAVSSVEPAVATAADGEAAAAIDEEISPEMKSVATSTSCSPFRPLVSPSSPTPLQQQLEHHQMRSNSVDSESSITSTTSTASAGLRGWWARASSSRRGPRPLMVGDRVSAGKWGEAVVLRVREKDAIVEVAFTRWRGRAFLHNSGDGFLREGEVGRGNEGGR